MQAIVKKLGPPKRPLSAPSMEDLKSTIKNICTVLWKIRTWQLIQIHYLLPKMWTRLVQKAMRRNTGFPPWRTLAITLQIFRRSSSQEGSRRLWGDWRSTWKERYWSITEPSAEPCLSNDRRMFFCDLCFFQAWVCNFEKPKTSPNSISPSTTVLSPYVTFGCLSVRTFWWRLSDVYEGVSVAMAARMSYFFRFNSRPVIVVHVHLCFRRNIRLLQSPSTASSCGESSSTPPVWGSPTLIRW